MKASELEGAKLDYWVAKTLGDRLARIVGAEEHERCETRFGEQWPWSRFMPSRAWMDGGPIIEREGIEWEQQSSTDGMTSGWLASVEPKSGKPNPPWQWGETQLIAAMRAYVAAKYGDEVPEE
jgi:hypothetical protein